VSRDVSFGVQHKKNLRGKRLALLNRHRQRKVAPASAADSYPNIYCNKPHLPGATFGDAAFRKVEHGHPPSRGKRRYEPPNQHSRSSSCLDVGHCS